VGAGPASARGRQLVFVGAGPDSYAADLLAYPSHNETFGLPILEAMACGCPVVTSQVSSMPEIAGGAAILCDPADPADPASIAEALVAGVAPDRDRLRDMGFRRAGEFTWAVAAASTLDVYGETAERRRRRRA
jgi:glycosyltransferase involved in cell wall biosynthesis